MYLNPGRRRGTGVADAPARQMPAGLHEGPRQDYLRRHEREATDAIRGSSQEKEAFFSRLLQRTADSRSLRLAWDYLASGDGQAPGIDRLRFHDLEDHEIWSLIRTLRESILAGTYRPAPDRRVSIPKASGKGTRTLSIPGIIDRLVQRAIVHTVQPYLDGILSVDAHDCSFDQQQIPGIDTDNHAGQNSTLYLLTMDRRAFWRASAMFFQVSSRKACSVLAFW
jgi:hypothetical protein